MSLNQDARNTSTGGDSLESVLIESRMLALENEILIEYRSILSFVKIITGAQSANVARLSGDGTETEVVFLDPGGLACKVDPWLPMPFRGLRSEVYGLCPVGYENIFPASLWAEFLPAGHIVVNSRDAIQGVGRVTIQTENMSLDESYCREYEGVVPGEYVLLIVSDTGIGMSSDVTERIFEPFFTTKEMGKGTGLGLAMVYGIVKQNNGFINIYSEPAGGSTFKLYFPRCEGEDILVRERAEKEVQGGSETILIAEDEAPLLRIASGVLTKQGYSVLRAAPRARRFQWPRSIQARSICW